MGLLNPQTVPQAVTVRILDTTITRTVTIPPRSRQAAELGAWGAQGDFGVEVVCETVCAAALTMWNRQLTVAHESMPLVGCEAR